MNKRELQGAFSKIHASDELIKEVVAMKNEERKSITFGRVLWKVATCAVVLAIILSVMGLWPAQVDPETGEIIAVPGVMKVYAAETELTESNNDICQSPIGGVVSSEMAVWMPFTSVAGFGIPLTLSVPESFWGDVEITFDVSAEYGYFLDQKMNAKNLGSNITVSNSEKVYWRGESIFDIADAVGENGVFYIDVIIRADEAIVGYGVISLVYKEYACMAYSAVTMGYPLVGGEFQDISEEFVLEQMESWKQ